MYLSRNTSLSSFCCMIFICKLGTSRTFIKMDFIFCRFQALIEREWLQAGYPFQKRHSRGCFSTTSTGRTKSHGATFLLFLDCVWQIQNQFICSFEFSPSLLYLLFEHSYASEYGKYGLATAYIVHS